MNSRDRKVLAVASMSFMDCRAPRLGPRPSWTALTGPSNPLPMLQHGHVAAHPLGDLGGDPRRGPAGAVGDLRRHMAPWIDDHRMSVGKAWLALALQVLAPGGGRGEPALRFDRARADHHLPMILAGRQGEGRWQEDHLGALFAQL